nr:S8 family serine peptidase [Nocardioides panaciterrulae]
MSRPAVGALLAAGALVPATLLPATLLPAGPARAEQQSVLCNSVDPDSRPVVQTGMASRPLQLMDVPAAQHLLDDAGRAPGARVAVAVLDSGVADTDLVPVVARHPADSGKGLSSYHGTAVAGLIAGRPRDPGGVTGVAPGAGIVDVRVYDTSDDSGSTEGAHPDTLTLAAGLEWVARHAHDEHIKVANVSLAVKDSTQLARAVRDAWDAGVVVVASSGNRPQPGQLNADTLGTFHPGEDAAGLVYPAGYPKVVAVNATAGGVAGDQVDLHAYVLENSQTDVAAPTYDAVSVAVNGSTCVLQEVATSWAAAEVSGVLALLRSRYPHDSPAQAVARLVGTATGSPQHPTPLEGAGVVQPVEALTRPLHADRDGQLTGTRPDDDGPGRATAPEPQADVLAATRDHAVWWGLLGGGALLLALLARPVLAGRRDPSDR